MLKRVVFMDFCIMIYNVMLKDPSLTLMMTLYTCFRNNNKIIISILVDIYKNAPISRGG
jgi:hypothetical protein